MQALSEIGHMNTGNLNLILFKYICNLIRAISLNHLSKNSANDLGRFLIHNPMIAIILIFEITVRTSAGKVFPRLSFGLKYGLDLL